MTLPFSYFTLSKQDRSSSPFGVGVGVSPSLSSSFKSYLSTFFSSLGTSSLE
jgi:hypothetical protein